MRHLGFAIVIRFDQWWMVGGAKVYAPCPDCGVKSELPQRMIDEFGYASIVCPHCSFRDWVLIEGWDLRG